MKESRTLALGDIHGSYKALVQVLRKSKFDYENDKLIVLGDLVDGWSESIEVIQELMKIKNLVYIIGNHDFYFYEFLKFGVARDEWVNQGGHATLKSFIKHTGLAKDKDVFYKEILGFLSNGVYYHEEDNRLFVHGGFNWKENIKDQEVGDLTWDRHLWQTVLMWDKNNLNIKVKQYDEVFIGHTTTTWFNNTFEGDTDPQNASNVWNLDQGCGWEGVLTIMDVETKKFWQSNYSKDLYPDEKGRR